MSSLPVRAAVVALAGLSSAPAQVTVDLSKHSEDCGVDLEHRDGRLALEWPIGGVDAGSGRLVLRLAPGEPLVESLGIARARGEGLSTVLESVDPVFFLTVGTRQVPPGKPAWQTWRVFFDSPAQRPHESHAARLELERVRVESRGRRATVSIETLTAGPFRGAVEVTLYAGSPLVHLEAVVSTDLDRRAILYDAGLAGRSLEDLELAWIDARDRSAKRWARAGSGAEGEENRPNADLDLADRALEVRHRLLAAQSAHGSVVCFPPPHQFFFPRDLSDNLSYVWFGRGHRGQEERFGFGIRQAERGGGGYVPWFNAPPGKKHRLGVFFLLSPGRGALAIGSALRYTRFDAFEPLPGHLTLTSHWHMAIAETAMKLRASGVDPLPVPELVSVFKELGVDMVHLGEFHGDGHQFDGGEVRLAELQAMFDECRRLSDEELLLIPGEEVNTYLGIAEPGKHPGHWMSLFPRPVYWILKRGEGQPFSQEHPKYGKVFRVGSRTDVEQLIAAEGALVWAAHPRIKASSWTPDIFRNQSFYLDASWLGGAWKAMPADLSEDRLGGGTLDLLSDMANWGQRKYMLGEVDVFKIDRTHELYGHMNANYLRLARLPRFEEGWKPVLDALRAGAFFVTTGEVLIRELRIGGKQSGEVLRLGPVGRAGATAAAEVEVAAELDWTFPLRFAEVVSGDGAEVYRERFDLWETGAFGRQVYRWKTKLAGRKWVRFEVWDVAANGAFTQPVWIE